MHKLILNFMSSEH